jgi:hypothetical protein
LVTAGAGEDALLALAIDPLWKVEFAIARWLGNLGTLDMMNALGMSIWGALCLTSMLILYRVGAARRGALSRAAGGRPTRG